MAQAVEVKLPVITFPFEVTVVAPVASASVPVHATVPQTPLGYITTPLPELQTVRVCPEVYVRVFVYQVHSSSLQTHVVALIVILLEYWSRYATSALVGAVVLEVAWFDAVFQLLPVQVNAQVFIAYLFAISSVVLKRDY